MQFEQSLVIEKVETCVFLIEQKLYNLVDGVKSKPRHNVRLPRM